MRAFLARFRKALDTLFHGSEDDIYRELRWLKPIEGMLRDIQHFLTHTLMGLFYMLAIYITLLKTLFIFVVPILLLIFIDDRRTLFFDMFASAFGGVFSLLFGLILSRQVRVYFVYRRKRRRYPLVTAYYLHAFIPWGRRKRLGGGRRAA